MKANGKQDCSFGKSNLLEIKIIRMLFSAHFIWHIYTGLVEKKCFNNSTNNKELTDWLEVPR
jgi:hypothetical protein